MREHVGSVPDRSFAYGDNLRCHGDQDENGWGSSWTVAATLHFSDGSTQRLENHHMSYSAPTPYPGIERLTHTVSLAGEITGQETFYHMGISFEGVGNC